MISYLSDVNL